jgi:hypothetical protein
MSIIEEDGKSMSPRSSFIGSDSDRSIFSRALSSSDSMMESLPINEILMETMS